MSPRTLFISATVAAGLAAGAAEASGPVAGAARSCGDFRGLGAQYVNDLTVKRVSCGKGKDVARSFNACRHRNGGSDGRCSSKVGGGFRCSEGKRESSPIQFSASVSCKKGRKLVKFIYADEA